MSAKSRFLNSVSGIALTAALATLGLPALADSQSVTGLRGPGTNQSGIPGSTQTSVEAETSDSLNQVEVTGIVTSNLAFQHLFAIGVLVNGWDIEASGATDVFVGPSGGADAQNSVIVIGSINGTILNLDYAPGSGSYGVLVADDIQAEDAFAQASDSGDGGAGVYNAAVAAIARNSIAITGAVAGSATDSWGVRVDGDVHASFALASVTVDNYFGPTNQASSAAVALNVVGIEGAVGGEGASGGSVGFYVAGDVYANFAEVDGGFFVSIPALGVSGSAASVYTTGIATLDIVASNSVTIAGSVGNDGGLEAIGVYVGGNVFAEGASVLGNALSDGGQLEDSFANGLAVARNAVVLTGTVSSPGGLATGIEIVGDVYAIEASAFGEGIARFGNFYDEVGGEATTAEFAAVASNAVSVSGAVSTANGVGVNIGGDVYASFAEAGAFAGANPYNYLSETNVSATAIALATNSVVIIGAVTADDAIGVAVEGSVFASYSDSEAVGTSYGEFTLDDEDPAPAVNAQTTVVSTASNAVSIVGTVGDSVTNGTGVDPIFVSANNAAAYGSAFAQATSNGGAGATATASNSVAASNAVGLTATLGDGATTSTGIFVDTFVQSNNAEADGFSTAYAYSTNADTISTAGATATAANDVEASNAVGVVAILGETVSGSTGIYIGEYVDAVFADAFGNSYASANVTAGGAADAVAGANQTVSASNLAQVNASIGAGASESTGVYIGEGVTAAFAFAEGSASAYAYNDSLGGDATATASQWVSATNGVGVSVTLGQDAVTSTGATIGNDVDAFAAFAEGFASATAQSQPGGPTGTGNAIATVNNSVSAGNGAGVSAAIGLASDNAIGIQIDWNLEAIDAEAIGLAEGYAPVNSGTGNATALVTNTVAAGNEAIAVGVLAGGNTLSVGVWIGEGIAAIGAFAEGVAEAEADASSTTGYALATANNTVTASNVAGAIATVGAGSTGSTGVYVGTGIIAMAAEAQGEANAGQLFDVGGLGAYSEGPSVGNATSAAIGSVVASNSVAIGGTVGAGSDGSTGVFVEAPGLYDLPFIGTVPVGAAAVNAIAEGLATAAAWAYGGTGNAQATASNNVFATNSVAIQGVVNAENSGGLGVGIGEGAVFAAFAEASGATSAYSERFNGTGNAVSGAGGTIWAGNIVSVLGTVGDASYDSDGVLIGQGPVGAGLAAADGFFFASANRPGPDAGDATASIGAEGALAAVYAGNAVAVGGTVSGVNGISGGTQANNGVWIGGDVGAVGALADGEFRATASRTGTGNGTGTASVWGEVAASNLVVIDGLVTVGLSAIDTFVGEGSTGAYIGGSVLALGSAALGYGRAEATGSQGATGDATATTSLATRAVNGIDISGAVESYNNESTGVYIGEGVAAALAFAEGSASAYADSDASISGLASAAAVNTVLAINSVSISGAVGAATYATNSDGVWIGEGVTATLAFAEGSADSNASRDGAGAGNATATATNGTQATNIISISGIVGDSINDYSTGVFIGEGVSASVAFAEGSAYASAERIGAGAGIATAAALDSVLANNVVLMVGQVGYDSWNTFGIDPAFVNASDATAISSAVAFANGPVGSTAIATSTATAHNIVDIDGTVGTQHLNGTGVWIGGDVTALDALASASTSVTTAGSAAGTGTATAAALNLVDLTGSVASNGDGSTGIFVGGNVIVGGLGVSLSNYADAAAGTTITSTGTGTMYNVVNITGDVGSGDFATNSTGVYIGGNVEFGGINGSSLNISLNGDGVSTALQVIEAANVSTITGAVGTNSSGSYGVWIGGNVQVTNNLVSSFIIEGSDATNDGTTRGVYIGGSVLTGDALNSQYAAQAGGRNTADPVIPDPVQIGDYVELAGSVFIGANGGLNPHGVAVGGGNDTVLVRDTHFQMEVVNGFDGGSNPDVDGQDRITFSNAQIFVSNIDNFELMNVTNTSAVFLTNPTPYIYAVRDEVNINVSSILSFGDGGAPPPFPIASGSPVNTLQLDTAMLTIGGIAGIKSAGPGIDDSILKAENNGTGSYVVNGEVFNFGTITLSKVLSAIRGTDPHALDGLSSTSFDTAGEQQFWAVNGGWNIDPTSGTGDRLQINGNYTAGSDVILDTFVFKSSSPSDVVEINGNVAGVTTVWINNTNTTGNGAFTGNGPNDGILVVDVNNGQDPNLVGQAFVLGNTSGWNWADPGNFPDPEMQVGAFIYTLNQGGPDDRNFYLRSQLLDQVPAYTVMTSAIQQHFYAELGTLYQRMGELRHADLGTKANTSFFEFWARAYGADLEIDPNKGFGFDMTSKGFMIGGDYAVRNWLGAQSRLHLGGFGGYGSTKLDDIKGDGVTGNSDGKTDGYTLGLYATYFDTAKKHQGLYADAVLKFNFLDSEYSSSTRDTKAKSDDFAWGASLELGYGIGLGNGFIIQPQGQLSYMQVSKEKVKESSPGIPLEVERDKAESLRGRLGLQLQNTWVTSGGTQFSPYIIGNVLHEFMGDNTTTVAGTAFRSDMGGTWFNAGAGFTVDFDNVGLYGHIEYNFGDRIEGLAAGLGVKIKLGGSSPVVAAAPPPAPALVPKKNYIVFFDFDRSNITADAQRVIDEAASAAKAGNTARVQLTGHTDRSGSEQYNMALSLRRGEAVKQGLIARGIPANSIFIIGRGESQPLVPTADGVREPQNRRVEIVL